MQGREDSMRQHDPFRPRVEPAGAIYDAFQNEAAKRKERKFEEWVAAEIQAVLGCAVEQAQKYGLRAPTREEVERAERYAMGSVDYGAKWSFGVVEAMRQPALPSFTKA